MVYLFDTSAVNDLHDDPESGALVTGLIATNHVWVSALNVVEAGSTTDPARRASLLRFLKHLTGNQRPVESPTILIQRMIEAYARRAPSVDLSVGAESDDMWAVLVDSGLADAEARDAAHSRRRQLEDEYQEIHREGRPHMQSLFESGAPRPPGVAALLRTYCRNDEFLWSVVNPFYARIVGADLPRGEARDLLRAVPEFAGFLLGWGHSIYRRAVAREGYGSGNAGALDLWFAAHLPRVDRFITADDAQYRALRCISRFFPRRRRVLRYQSWRRSMLIGSPLAAVRE